MNRQQRRAMQHNPQYARIKRNLDHIAEFNEVMSRATKFKGLVKAGDKVRFDMDAILSDPTYAAKQKKHKQFIEDHKDAVLTIEYDPKFGSDPVFVCLAEDNSEIKMLWTQDQFIKVKEESDEVY